jgi:retron-type reverse transcriptase
MVQGAMKIVLGAMYEPRYLRVSHGFHPNHLCYITFKQIKQEWKGTHMQLWFVTTTSLDENENAFISFMTNGVQN